MRGIYKYVCQNCRAEENLRCLEQSESSGVVLNSQKCGGCAAASLRVTQKGNYLSIILLRVRKPRFSVSALNLPHTCGSIRKE